MVKRDSAFGPEDSTQRIEPSAVQNTELLLDPGTRGFAEDRKGEPSRLSVSRSTDLHGNHGEEVEYVYSPPGSSVKLTMRKAYSTAFAGMSHSPTFGMNDDNSGPPGFSAVSSDASTLASSQRVDWKVVDRENFSVTAFGYQNEVGTDFRPFGKSKKEFTRADSSITKAGGNVRLGPLGIGFTQSATGNAELSIEYGGSPPKLAATHQEVNATLDLPKLLANLQEPSGLSSGLFPILWATQSYNRPASEQDSGDLDTTSTSFGGSWSWDSGQGTLGYWSYSSDGPAARTGSAWDGRGIDASLGFYYSSLALDLDFSYGHMEDVAGSWQSASALYNSSVTLSYKGENLPPVWATASAGNFDYNSLGGTALPSAGTVAYHGESARNEYWSISTGVDLSSLFWNAEASHSDELAKQHSSLKLVFQYTDNLYLDSAGPTKSADGLVAILVQSTL